MKRRLSLRSERVAELADAELEAVVAAQQALPTQFCTGYYRTINAPCPTLDGCFTGTTGTS